MRLLLPALGLLQAVDGFTMIVPYGGWARTSTFSDRRNEHVNVHDSVTITTTTTTTTTTLQASRSICTFEESDFALPIGEWPYTPSDMGRVDASNDSKFYDSPKFVTHIDDRAIESLTDFYLEELSALARAKTKNGTGDIDVLDLCSSWISHLPVDNNDEKPLPYSYGRVVGVGMNEEELKENSQLTEYRVQDLNDKPTLKYEDNSFDIVSNVVSVDYLTSPREIFQEIHRVLRPGGICLMSFSNRCFPTKAVAMWLQADDIGRMTIIGSYYHYTAKWNSIEALDIKLPEMNTPKRPSFNEMLSNPSAGFAWMTTASAVAKANGGDPMFVVKGIK